MHKDGFHAQGRCDGTGVLPTRTPKARQNMCGSIIALHLRQGPEATHTHTHNDSISRAVEKTSVRVYVVGAQVLPVMRCVGGGDAPPQTDSPGCCSSSLLVAMVIRSPLLFPSILPSLPHSPGMWSSYLMGLHMASLATRMKPIATSSLLLGAAVETVAAAAAASLTFTSAVNDAKEAAVPAASSGSS